MQTQEPTAYNPEQKMLADAYRVHKINSSYMKGLHSGTSQLAVIRLAQGGRVSPEFWQQMCTGIDRTAPKPLGEMSLNIGPVEVSVHDILAMVSKIALDLTPRISLYPEMNLAIARALLDEPEMAATELDKIDTAVTVFHQVAIQFFNLACEWYLHSNEDTEARQMFSSLTANAVDIMLRSSIFHYVPEANQADCEALANKALADWAARHYEAAKAKPGPVNSYIPFVAIITAVVLSDIPNAEELLLASNAAIYNPEYKSLQDIDRAYIVFHQALGVAKAK